MGAPGGNNGPSTDLKSAIGAPLSPAHNIPCAHELRRSIRSICITLQALSVAPPSFRRSSRHLVNSSVINGRL